MSVNGWILASLPLGVRVGVRSLLRVHTLLILVSFLFPTYSFVFSEDQKRYFEKLVIYCDNYANLIPVSFVLGEMLEHQSPSHRSRGSALMHVSPFNPICHSRHQKLTKLISLFPLCLLGGQGWIHF